MELIFASEHSLQIHSLLITLLTWERKVLLQAQLLTSQVVCQCYFWPLNGCWRSAMNLWEEFSTPVVLTNMITCKCQWRGDRIPIPLETCSIFKLQFKNSLSNVFSHLHIIMNSARTEQNPPQNSIWLQGISLFIISTSCRWPAWPRRSTMQV